jgi:hypothetical protein
MQGLHRRSDDPVIEPWHVGDRAVGESILRRF